MTRTAVGENSFYKDLVGRNTRAQKEDVKARAIVKVQSKSIEKVLLIFNNKYQKKSTKTHFPIQFIAFYPLHQEDRMWYLVTEQVCPEIDLSYIKTLTVCQKLFPRIRMKIKSRYSHEIATKIDSENGYFLK